MASINLSDKDLASILLNQHKMEATSLTTLILESRSDKVRKTATTMLQECFDHQKQIFDMMAQKGWYQVQNATQQEMTAASQAATTMQQQMQQQMQ